MKQTPKYIKNLVKRMNRKIYEAQELNEQLENWLEKNGADYGYDFVHDYIESMAYSVYDEEGLFKAIEELNGGE